jgi:hypothetical protein
MVAMITDGKEEVHQDWYFTFAPDHSHPNQYVKFHGTFMGTRRKMLSVYGQRWSGQYDHNEIIAMRRKYKMTEHLPTPAELGIARG